VGNGKNEPVQFTREDADRLTRIEQMLKDDIEKNREEREKNQEEREKNEKEHKDLREEIDTKVSKKTIIYILSIIATLATTAAAFSQVSPW